MATSYSVTSQEENTVIAPSGKGFQKVWDIGFLITSGPAKGMTGTVTVQDTDHNAAYVGQAIEDKISSMHDIASLGSGS